MQRRIKSERTREREREREGGFRSHQVKARCTCFSLGLFQVYCLEVDSGLKDLSFGLVLNIPLPP